MKKMKEKSQERTELKTIDDTPFTIGSITRDNGKEEHFVLCSNYKLNEEPFPNFEEALEYCYDFTWDKIITVIGIMCENFLKTKGIFKL